MTIWDFKPAADNKVMIVINNNMEAQTLDLKCFGEMIKTTKVAHILF